MTTWHERINERCRPTLRDPSARPPPSPQLGRQKFWRISRWRLDAGWRLLPHATFSAEFAPRRASARKDHARELQKSVRGLVTPRLRYDRNSNKYLGDGGRKGGPTADGRDRVQQCRVKENGMTAMPRLFQTSLQSCFRQSESRCSRKWYTLHRW